MSQDFVEAFDAPWQVEADDVAPFQKRLQDLAEAIEGRYRHLTAQAVRQSALDDVADEHELVLRVAQRGVHQSPWDLLCYRVLGPNRIESLSEKKEVFEGIEEFNAHLQGLARGSLRRSLALLEEQSSHPYRGELRTVDATTLGSRDVQIRLSSETFRELSDVERGDAIEVEFIPTNELAPIMPQTTYRFMTVEGCIWEIESGPFTDEGQRHWKVVVQAVTDTDASVHP